MKMSDIVMTVIILVVIYDTISLYLTVETCGYQNISIQNLRHRIEQLEKEILNHYDQH